MSEKKVGKRLLTWVLVLVMTLSLLPLNVLADEAEEPSNVKYGMIGTNGTWAETENSTGTNNSTGITGVKSVSKTAKPTTDKYGKIISNQYDVTLKVELEQTTSTTLPGAAATVLVMDHSASTNPIIWDCIFYVFTDKLFANLLMFHLLFLAAQFLSIKIVSQKAEKCNHIPRLFQITSHFSLILFFDMF